MMSDQMSWKTDTWFYTYLSLRTTPSIHAPKRTTLLKSVMLTVKEIVVIPHLYTVTTLRTIPFHLLSCYSLILENPSLMMLMKQGNYLASEAVVRALSSNSTA